MPLRHGQPERIHYFHVTSARDHHELIDWISAHSEAHALTLIEDEYQDDPSIAITYLGTDTPSTLAVEVIHIH